MSEIRANTISDAAGTGPVTLTGQYAAKAWVNFNGTSTVAIRQSGNVSSITDNGTGDYRVNYTTAFADANYCVSLMSDFNASGGFNANSTDALLTTSVSVYTYGIAGGGSGAYADTDTVHVSIIR